jgi:hypothetical protein
MNKTVLRPSVFKFTCYALSFIDDLIGVLTLGAYSPYFALDYLMHRMRKKLNNFTYRNDND